MRILERRAKFCTMIRKFSGERVRVGCIDEGIQPQVAMTLRVRHRHHIFLGFDEDLRSVAADDREKRVSLRLLKSHLKAQLVAVISNGLPDAAD